MLPWQLAKVILRHLRKLQTKVAMKISIVCVFVNIEKLTETTLQQDL